MPTTLRRSIIMAIVLTGGEVRPGDPIRVELDRPVVAVPDRVPEPGLQRTPDPEVIAKALYTGGHDATLLAVANGKVDAGALDETVFQRMTKEGKVPAEKVRVFHRTAPFFDYVWVARKGLDPRLQQTFAAAFLNLDAAKPADKAVLDLFSATHYLKAEDKSYDRLRAVARQAGLLK